MTVVRFVKQPATGFVSFLRPKPPKRRVGTAHQSEPETCFLSATFLPQRSRSPGRESWWR
jgi:hypothetical protein